MLPSHQRLKGGHFLGLQIDERLIEEPEPVLRKRGAHISFEQRAAPGRPHPFPDRTSDRCRGRPDFALYMARSALFRKFSASHLAGTCNRDPDAGAYCYIVTVDAARLTDNLDDFFCQRDRRSRLGCRHLQDREFIATKSRDAVGSRQNIAELGLRPISEAGRRWNDPRCR